MRHFEFFGLFFLFVLTACNNANEDFSAMNAVVRQAETIYQHLGGNRFPNKENDSLQLSTELIRASDFFASKNCPKEASQAYLFSGYAQKESNDKACAMKCFKNAEHYGTLANDSITIARAQYNIAILLYDDKAFEESIAIANLADKNIGNHYDERALIHNLMASSYILQKNYDSAEHHLQQALALDEKGLSDKTKRRILNNYSVLYREQGMYDNAINCLKQNLYGDDLNDLTKVFLNIGKINMYDDQYDSAVYYLNKALDLSKTYQSEPAVQASTYFSLYYSYKKLRDFKKSLECFEIYDGIQYNYQKERENKNLYAIQKQYDYETLQNQMNKKIIQKQRTILIISFCLLLASILVIGLLLRQKTILKEDERIRKELDKMNKDLQNSIRSEVAEDELSRQLHLIIAADRIAKHNKDYNKEWSSLIYKINNGQNNMFDAATIAIERIYPKLYPSILENHPDFNNTEAKVMLLSCSNLTNAEMGYILGLSVHSINKSRSEINKKIDLSSKV